MTAKLPEQALEGGKLSSVVRIGDTVRRPVGPWTPAVHALLHHLEEHGFKQAPRALGTDENGREILSFIPGTTVGASHPWPRWVWHDAILSKTGRWLREYHDTVRDFREPAGSTWRMSWAQQRSDEIICHFDVAPYNLVLTPDQEIAFIDWDVAAPGTALLELAKVANSFASVYDVEARAQLNFSEGELNPAMLASCVHRIRVLLDAYGLDERGGFVSAMLDAAHHTHQRIHRGAREGDVALEQLIESGLVDHVLETRKLFERYLEPLQLGIEA